MGSCCSFYHKKSKIINTGIGYEIRNCDEKYIFGYYGVKECIICRENYTKRNFIYVTGCCNSLYHKKCIEDWTSRQNNCPICRNTLNL